MKAKIVKLSLFGFRGATKPVEINFDTSKPVALIFGENGTGKSTIADAIDFICNGHFGSLEDRSMSAQPKTHVASLGHDPKKLRVLLTTPCGTFTAVLSKGGPAIAPASGCPDARILRRSNVLQLLNAQPKQRFEALKTFISVPGIERSEEALREACRTADANYDEAVRAYTQAITALEELWATEGKPGKSALAWAEEEVAKDLSVLERAISRIGEISTGFHNAESALSSLDLGKAGLAKACVAQTKAEEDQNRIQAMQTQKDVALLSLLQSAESYVAAHKQSAHCPVCEQGVQTESLLARLESRIADMNELGSSATAVAAAKSAVEGKRSILTEARKQFCERVSILGSLLKSNTLKEVTELEIGWVDYEDVLTDAETTEALESKARALLGASLLCKQPLAEHKLADQKSINQHNAIKGHRDTY